MAGAPNPASYKEAAPYIIWGILVFSFGLEGVVGLVHGEILVAAVSFVGMGAVIAAALHWNQLKAGLPRSTHDG